MENLDGLDEALLLFEQGKYANAVVSLQELEKRKGGKFELFELMGVCYFHMKDWGYAIKSLSTASSYLEAPQPNTYHFLGLARLYRGEFAHSFNDLVLALRYTPFESLQEKPELLSAAFTSAVLAGDGRAPQIFRLAYSNCPLRFMEEVKKIFEGYFSQLDIPEEEKSELGKRIEALRKLAIADQMLFERRSQKREEELTGLLGNLKDMKLVKTEKESNS